MKCTNCFVDDSQSGHAVFLAGTWPSLQVTLTVILPQTGNIVIVVFDLNDNWESIFALMIIWLVLDSLCLQLLHYKSDTLIHTVINPETRTFQYPYHTPPGQSIKIQNEIVCDAVASVKIVGL